MKSLYLSLVMGMLVAITANADLNKPVLGTVDLEKVFVPIGFDDNDQTQVVVAGRFPNTCYQVGPYEVAVDEVSKVITVNQKAYVYGGICLRMVVPFNQTIDIGFVSKGNYTIVDGQDGEGLGSLDVVASTHPGPGTDDYIYAPVEDAFVEQNQVTAKWEAVLRGSFTSSCMSLANVELNKYSEVIVLQPIAQIEESTECESGSYAFEERVDLGEQLDGAFLLHVRSMNGKAINKVYGAND